MTSITYVGMDVHTTNYTLCCYTIEEDKPFALVQIKPETGEILKYLDRIKKQRGSGTRFICGYEAGCLGYSLYHQLTKHGVECVILAPTTMPVAPGKRVKTDRKDAENISRCLAYHLYKPVHIPTDEDDSIKEYIRMRDDVNAHLKQTKQQILSFCTRHGYQFDGKSYWTQKHLNWLEKLVFENDVYRETLWEYLALYYQLDEKIAVFDTRIAEFSHRERYEENVQKLGCFAGIATRTAMSLLVEIGDFNRFQTAQQFSAYLGLVPGESSSGEKQIRTSITKAGNAHVRWLLTESAQHYGRGVIGKKSKRLLERQAGVAPEVVAYADRANERLKRKFYKIMLRSKRNIATTAVARELSCFIWGMMTGNIV